MDLKGIPVYRFTLQPNTLAAPVDNPDNQCYCTDEKVTRNCTVAGALDVGACKSQSSRWSTRRTVLFVPLSLTKAIFFNVFYSSPLNVKKVKGVYISLPHFLHGSDILVENVQGLNPTLEEHMTYLDVEPVIISNSML